MSTVIPPGGKTFDRTPEINIGFLADAPINAVVKVLRNGTAVGDATRLSPRSFQFTDTAPLGIAAYTAEIIRGTEKVASRVYQVEVSALPVPVVNEIFGVIPANALVPSGGQTTSTALSIKIGVATVLPAGAAVDVFSNTEYVGSATPTSGGAGLLYELDLTGLAPAGGVNYTARIRYGAFVPVPSPVYQVEITASLPQATVSLEANLPLTSVFALTCPVPRINDGSFIIEIGVPYTESTAVYQVRDSGGNIIDLGANVNLNHVALNPTYYTIRSSTTEVGDAAVDYIGEVWTLVRIVGAQPPVVVATAVVPNCGFF